jgi:Ca2+-binding RTX toxin-like protein
MTTFIAFFDDSSADGTQEADVGLAFGMNCTLNGLGGDDNLSAGTNTTLNGGDGADRLIGGAGDALNGGAGKDRIDVNLQEASSDITVDLRNIYKAGGVSFAGVTITDCETGFLSLGSGADTAAMSAGAELYVYGFDGDDALTGAAGRDTLAGGNGADVLRGQGGEDLIYGFAPETFGQLTSTGVGAPDDGLGVNLVAGGGGDDVLVSAMGDDVLNGGQGADTASYAGIAEGGAGVRVDLASRSQDTGGAGVDRLRGIENLVGGGGGDVLIGAADPNRIDGALGDDVVAGGFGADTLIGGEGSDRFQYKSLAELEGDTIVDLDNPDTLDLRGIDADETKAGNQSFKVVGEFHGKAGELVLTYDGGHTNAAVDVDGDGTADAAWIINGNHESDQTNFVL